MIDNRPLRDDRLSWKARGLLAYLLSQPHDWKINAKHLASIGPDGPRAIQSGLKELAAIGYAKLETGGRSGGRNWLIYETTELGSENAVLASSVGGENAVMRTSQNANIAKKLPTKDQKLLRTDTDTKEGEGPDRPSSIDFAAAWNEAGLSAIRVFPAGRQKHLASRNADEFFRANWRTAIAKVRASSFCMGNNDRGWRANVDWFLRPDSVARIMEGNYDDRRTYPSGVVRGQRPPSPGVSTVLHPNGYDEAAAEERHKRWEAKKRAEGTLIG